MKSLHFFENHPATVCIHHWIYGADMQLHLHYLTINFTIRYYNLWGYLLLLT